MEQDTQQELLQAKAKGFDLLQQLDSANSHIRMLEGFIRQVGQNLNVPEVQGQVDLQAILDALPKAKPAKLRPQKATVVEPEKG